MSEPQRNPDLRISRTRAPREDSQMGSSPSGRGQVRGSDDRTRQRHLPGRMQTFRAIGEKKSSHPLTSPLPEGEEPFRCSGVGLRAPARAEFTPA